MKPELVRFSSHPRPFLVQTDQCDNPDCPCVEVRFHLAEVDEDNEAAGLMSFNVQVDPEKWEEIKPPARSAAIASFVREFLRDYPEDERAAFREAGRDKQQVGQRLRDYRIDPRVIAKRTLIAFGGIASEGGSISSRGTAYDHRFSHEGTDYYIDDLYCPHPECNCREVHLHFFRYTPPKQPGSPSRIEQLFLVSLSLNGRLSIDDCVACSRQEAETIAAAWHEWYGNDLREYRWRYDKVKEIARRSMSAVPAASRQRDIAPPAPISAAPKPGRNDPCPCGSGKKYKKCCGR